MMEDALERRLREAQEYYDRRQLVWDDHYAEVLNRTKVWHRTMLLWFVIGLPVAAIAGITVALISLWLFGYWR